MHSRAAADRLKAGAQANDLLDRLRSDPVFQALDFDHLLDPAALVGRAPEQVTEFLEQEITAIRQRYPHLLGQGAELHV